MGTAQTIYFNEAEEEFLRNVVMKLGRCNFARAVKLCVWLAIQAERVTPLDKETIDAVRAKSGW